VPVAGGADPGAARLPPCAGDGRRACRDPSGALAASAALQERGFLVGAIRPPTVPDGQARLRVTLSALHSERDVDALVAALTVICKDTARAHA